jgi:hypothetical protein
MVEHGSAVQLDEAWTVTFVSTLLVRIQFSRGMEIAAFPPVQSTH